MIRVLLRVRGLPPAPEVKGRDAPGFFFATVHEDDGGHVTVRLHLRGEEWLAHSGLHYDVANFHGRPTAAVWGAWERGDADYMAFEEPQPTISEHREWLEAVRYQDALADHLAHAVSHGITFHPGTVSN